MSEKDETILGLFGLPPVYGDNLIGECDRIPANSEDEVIMGNIGNVPFFIDEKERTDSDSQACSQIAVTNQNNKASQDNHQCSERSTKRKRKEERQALSCCVCNLLFQDSHDLQYHLKTHSDVEIIPQEQSAKKKSKMNSMGKKECAVCGRLFRYNSHLREHILCMHNKTSFFSCPVCAHNITMWRRSIDRHMSNHTIKSECPSCFFQAKDIQAIDDHILAQGEGHLRCRRCDNTFNNRLQFFSHVSNHIPKIDLTEAMVCRHCGFKSNLTSDYNDHVRTKCAFKGPNVNLNNVTTEKHEEVPHTVVECLSEHNRNIDVEVIDISSNASKETVPVTFVPNNASVDTYQIVTTTCEDGSTAFILIPQLILHPSIAATSGLIVNENIVSQVSDDPVFVLNYAGSGQNVEMPILKKAVESVKDVEVQPAEQSPSHDNNDDCIVVKTQSFVDDASPSMSIQNVCSLGAPQDKSQASCSSVFSNVPTWMCPVSCEVSENSKAFENPVQSHKTVITPVVKATPLKKATEIRIFVCKDCGQSFALQDHLHEHSITFHSDIEGIVCPVCKQSISGVGASLNEHLAKVHNLRVDQSGKLLDCTTNV